MELQFSRSSSDLNGNGREAAPFHSELELFVGFVNPVMLEAVHG